MQENAVQTQTKCHVHLCFYFAEQASEKVHPKQRTSDGSQEFRSYLKNIATVNKYHTPVECARTY